MHCSLEELDRREITRGDRVIGQARGQFDIVHAQMRYGIEVDSTDQSPAMLAREICDRLPASF